MKKVIVSNLVLLVFFNFNSCINTYQIVGGGGGEAFRLTPYGDYRDHEEIERVSVIRIWAGRYVDAIELVWETENGGPLNHKVGGTGGILNDFRLRPDERVEEINIRHGNYIDKIEIITDQRTLGEAGGDGGILTKFLIPENEEFWGFRGRAGRYIDAIGIMTRTRQQ